MVLELLEDRFAPATWDGGGGNALRSNAANWEGDVLPPNNDIVVIPAVGASANVIFDASVLGSGITIASLTSNKPFVLSGDTLTVTGNVEMQNGNTFTLQGGTLAGALSLNGKNWTNNGTVKAENGGNLTLQSSVTTSPGWTSSTVVGVGEVGRPAPNWCSG